MMEDKGLDRYLGDLSRNAVAIAEVLQSAGYATYASGKWHVTPFAGRGADKHNWPLQRGFQRYYGIIGGAANYFDPATLVCDNTPEHTIQPMEGRSLVPAFQGKPYGEKAQSKGEAAKRPMRSERRERA